MGRGDAMPGEVLYFVSDTHLGDGTASDRFRYPRQLMALLSRIEAEPSAHLVLLGDLMELWAASMEAVLVHHAAIFRAIARIAAKHHVTYIVGNHDCLPWYYFLGQALGKLRVAERFVSAGSGLTALHGHQFDPLNRVTIAGEHVKVPWTRKLVQIVGTLERIGGDKAGDTIEGIGELLSHVVERESPCERGYPDGESAYAAGARSLMRAGARFVVMGHTHHPLVQCYGERLYVNTGCWVWDRYPPTYARFASGRLELLHGESHQPYAPPT
jgi:UDP-2,3-diacylglucosamine pyrophosphatase LpxH